MNIDSPKFQPTPDTVSELRDLYRSAEARAARLRLLFDAGRDLYSAEQDALDAVLKTNARRAALFAGFQDGEIIYDAGAEGVPLIAPGPEGRRVGTLKLIGETDPRGVSDEEDREALDMLAQLIAATVDRKERNAERDRLLAALQEREQHLEHLVGRLFSAQEDERRYVSRELHDGVAQTATALFRRLDARLPVEGDADSEDTQLADIAKGLVRELRAVIAGLRPTALDDLGLVPAIETLADELRTDGYDVTFSKNIEGEWPQILTTAYFRIAQEALSNIRKHAGGKCKVNISLHADAARKRWRLEIRDYGKGFRTQEDRKSLKGQHVGIEMMRERMTAVGGALQVEPQKPGVVITAVTEFAS
ncbi:MAG: ATP-binding protein [Pseudomonadota bacterium]